MRLPYCVTGNFFIQLLPLKSLVLLVHFLNAFWHRNETFPKGSSQYENVTLLVVFHLPYSKYKGMKVCFYPCGYRNKIFHSRWHRVVRVALVSLVSHLCRTLVASVALVLYSCRMCCTFLACVWHSCCKLDQIQISNQSVF